MLNYAETASSSTTVLLAPLPCSHPQEQSTESLPVTAQQQGKEAGQGIVTFRKAVIATNNAEGFLTGIECGQACGQACYVDEDYPITSKVLVDICAEVVDNAGDLPEDHLIGFLVGYLDALLRARKTYPRGWFS